MIKVIAFDLVGVLVNENDINLSYEEDKLERMFGKNISDSDYLNEGKKLIKDDSILIQTIEDIINKIYNVRDKDIFKKIKDIYPNIKIVIATNHVSFIKKYIEEVFNMDYIDDILISAEIHKIKPNKDFYEYILKKYDIDSNELLFIDDNIENIEAASNLNINTIKANNATDILKEITDIIKK